jgi:hypothetical protein
MLYASVGDSLVLTQVTSPKSNSFSVPSAANPMLSGFKSEQEGMKERNDVGTMQTQQGDNSTMKVSTQPELCAPLWIIVAPGWHRKCM